MPRLPVTLLACLALTGGAVAGCGDDDSDDTASTPAPAAQSTAPADDAAASGDVVKVNMKDIEFVPADITVKVGQKILWTNTDGNIPHTVTAREGADFDSGNMDGGDTFDFTPKQAGTIAYVCTIHAGQKGSITVK
ncbi:MAG: plastocyanin/azurin family copper-binding protein [Solirubrobacteraceae bacterium]